MPIGDLNLQEQKEAYRHVEEMSQRFLRVILATLALGFVFARPGWIDYMTSASPPSPGLRAYQGDAYIGNLTPTMVLNNGSILKALVVLGLFSLLIAIFLAGLVLFLLEPSETFQSEQETAIAYHMLQKTSKTFLRRAYIAAFVGVLFLVLAAGGFWAFYVAGGVNILLFDVAVVVLGLVSLPAFVLRIGESLSFSVFKEVNSSQRAVELSIYCMSAVIAIFFYRYALYNAIKALVVWMRFTGVL